MGRQKGRTAWLVTWEQVGDSAVLEKIAAILKPQLGGERVRDLVGFLYASLKYEPYEQLEIIAGLRSTPYPPAFGSVKNGPAGIWQGEVICGDNPFLKARMVERDRRTISAGALSSHAGQRQTHLRIFHRQHPQPAHPSRLLQSRRELRRLVHGARFGRPRLGDPHARRCLRRAARPHARQAHGEAASGRQQSTKRTGSQHIDRGHGWLRNQGQVTGNAVPTSTFPCSACRCPQGLWLRAFQ